MPCRIRNKESVLVTFADDTQGSVYYSNLINKFPWIGNINEIISRINGGALKLSLNGKEIVKIRVIPTNLDLARLSNDLENPPPRKEKIEPVIHEKTYPSPVDCISLLVLGLISIFLIEL